MGVDEGNIQVMDERGNDNEKLSNIYSYGTYLQVATMVYKLRKLYRVIYSVHVCLQFTLYLEFVFVDSAYLKKK